MPATAPRLTYLPDLLEEHIEEVEFLWAQREAALLSARQTQRDLAHCDERIQGHVQGILAAGEHAPPLLEERLAGDDDNVVFAAAYPMLRSGSAPAADRLLEAFSTAEGPRLDGLKRALAFGAPPVAMARLRALLLSTDPPVAAAAAEILAFHRQFGSDPGRLLLLVRDEDAAVRRQAWRVAAYLGIPLEAKLYAAAMRDEDTGVREAGLLAAAWSRVPGALTLARQIAQAPAPENIPELRLLAVLGGAEDLPRIRGVVTTAALGPARFRIAAAFGHPLLVDLLVADMANPDPATAVAAGEAFTRITGQAVDSSERVKLAPEGGGPPDEFESEFQDEVLLPDPELARKHWEKVKPQFAGAVRLARGLDLSRGATAEVLGTIDLESRLEASMRGRFQGSWHGSAIDLEAFPQPSPPGSPLA
jgi:uncharacterized protein (TIGR02270 family)